MSKERLNEIQKLLRRAKEDYDRGYRNGMEITMGFLFTEGHVHFLLKQAEWVEGLLHAHELKELEHQGLVQKLKEKDEQNKRYRELLEEVCDAEYFDEVLDVIDEYKTLEDEE